MELSRTKAANISVGPGQDRKRQSTGKVKSWAHVVSSSPPKPGSADLKRSTVQCHSAENRPKRQIGKVSGQSVVSPRPYTRSSREVRGALQCELQSAPVEQIDRLLRQGGAAHTVNAAKLLNQLLNASTESVQPKAINQFKSKIYNVLFKDVFETYQAAMDEQVSFEHVSNALIDCKSACLRNSDFLFVLRDKVVRDRWLKIASLAWRNSVCEISREGHVISEQDINELGDLIKASPPVSDPVVRSFLYKALGQTFDQYKDKYTDFDEKIELLANWIKSSDGRQFRVNSVCRKWMKNHCPVSMGSSSRSEQRLQHRYSDGRGAESGFGKKDRDTLATQESQGDPSLLAISDNPLLGPKESDASSLGPDDNDACSLGPDDNDVCSLVPDDNKKAIALRSCPEITSQNSDTPDSVRTEPVEVRCSDPSTSSRVNGIGEIIKGQFLNDIWATDLTAGIELENEVYDFNDRRLNRGVRLIVRAILGLEEIIRYYPFQLDDDRNEWVGRMVDRYCQGAHELAQWGGQLESMDEYHHTEFKNVLGRLFVDEGDRKLHQFFERLIDRQKQFSPDGLSSIKDLSLLRDWLLEVCKRFKRDEVSKEKL